MKMAKLSDDEIVQLCTALIRDSAGITGDQTSIQRLRAMDYYLGEMDEYLPVPEDRSSIVSRDVLDTVESVLPSLMRIFLDSENAVVFKPHGPEDEDQAKQESDVVRHVFFNANDGFLNLYTFIKDALLSRTGIIKCGWKPPVEKREEYKGLEPVEFDSLLNEPGVDAEVVDANQDPETGEIDCVLKVAREKGEVTMRTVPPEEFGIARNASSPNPKDASFKYHRVRTLKSDLIKEGYPRDIVDELPAVELEYNEEHLARNRDDDLSRSTYIYKAIQEVWVYECFLPLDMNDDGISELYKVTLGGGEPVASGLKMLDKEEVDSSYFSSCVPVIVTHQFNGMSMADLVMDLQEIRTMLKRNIIDNTFAVNNVRLAANDNVNLDDLLSPRPGGVIQVRGDSHPSEAIWAVPTPAIPQQAYGLLEMLEEEIKQRTGVGDEVAGLDTEALSNVNTGVMIQAFDQARMRIELIARIIAEVGLKSVFRDIHELLCKNQDKTMAVKLRNSWVDVNPSEWRERTNLEVKIGIGNATKEKRLMTITDIMRSQAEAMQMGLPVVQPQNFFNALKEKSEAHGIETSLYFTDPSTLPPPPQPPPDPNMIALQQQGQIEQGKLELKDKELQLKEREIVFKEQNETTRSQIELEKRQIDEQSQIMHADNERVRDEMNAELKKYATDMSMLIEQVRQQGASQSRMEAFIEKLIDKAGEVEVEATTGTFTNDA